MLLWDTSQYCLKLFAGCFVVVRLSVFFSFFSFQTSQKRSIRARRTLGRDVRVLNVLHVNERSDRNAFENVQNWSIYLCGVRCKVRARLATVLLCIECCWILRTQTLCCARRMGGLETNYAVTLPRTYTTRPRSVRTSMQVVRVRPGSIVYIMTARQGSGGSSNMLIESALRRPAGASLGLYLLNVNPINSSAPGCFRYEARDCVVETCTLPSAGTG